jgi:hypothetical protein
MAGATVGGPRRCKTHDTRAHTLNCSGWHDDGSATSVRSTSDPFRRVILRQEMLQPIGARETVAAKPGTPFAIIAAKNKKDKRRTKR